MSSKRVLIGNVTRKRLQDRQEYIVVKKISLISLKYIIWYTKKYPFFFKYRVYRLHGTTVTMQKNIPIHW